MINFDRDFGNFQRETMADLMRLRNENLPANPVIKFTVTPNDNSWGATLDYTLGPDLSGCSSLRVLRNDSTDYSSATVLVTNPLAAEDANRDFQYIDLDKSLTSDTYYWVETIPLPSRAGLAQTRNITNSPIVSGPIKLAALNASLLPPDALTGFSASLGVTQSGNPQFQKVYVNFSNTPDPSFESCQITVTGYNGDTNEVIQAQSAYSPFTFNLAKTSETVTLKAYAISQNGIKSASSLSTTLTLNGTETVPAKLLVVNAVAITAGVQLDWVASLEPDVTSYKIYSGAHGAGFGSATLLHTTSASGSNHYTFLDTGGLVVPPLDYFIVAHNTIGDSTASDAASATVAPQNMDQIGDGATYVKVPQFSGRNISVANANFEASATIIPPPGFKSTISSGTISYETGSPSEGLQSLKILNCPTNQGLISVQKYPVIVGEQYFVQASMKGDGTLGAARTSLVFFDGTGTSTGSIDALGGNPTSASWNVYENSGTAPANSVYAQITLQNYHASAGTVYFDDIHCIRQTSMDNELADGSTFRRLKYVDATNTISVSTALNGQGSIVPGQAVSITGTLAPTTLTLTWSAQTLLRADGSTLSVPASTGSGIQYTGLSNSTTYFIYLKINASTGVITSQSSNPPSTSSNAVTAAQCALDGFIPIPAIQMTTQSGGGTGGSGGGGGLGGGGTCPEKNERIDVALLENNDPNGQVLQHGPIKSGEAVAGMFIKGYCFETKTTIYRRILQVSVSDLAAWYIVNGHKVSPCEPIWDGTNWVPAFKVAGAVFDGSTGVRVNITVESDNFNNSNYWLVDGEPLLIHNTFVLPC